MALRRRNAKASSLRDIGHGGYLSALRWVCMRLPISPDSSLLDSVTVKRGLSVPVGARALVLIAHPDEASRRQAGQGFVADVLHANGFATLPFSLHTSHDAAAGLPPPGMVQGRLRLRGLFDWVLQQRGLGAPPLALIGVGDAASVCVAMAARSDRIADLFAGAAGCARRQVDASPRPPEPADAVRAGPVQCAFARAAACGPARHPGQLSARDAEPADPAAAGGRGARSLCLLGARLDGPQPRARGRGSGQRRQRVDPRQHGAGKTVPTPSRSSQSTSTV